MSVAFGGRTNNHTLLLCSMHLLSKLVATFRQIRGHDDELMSLVA